MKETITSLNLTFSTESKKDTEFMVECLTLLVGTITLLRMMRDGCEEINATLAEAGDESKVIPIIKTVSEAQSQLFVAVDLFTGMVLSRQIGGSSVHDAPQAVQ